MKSRNCIVFGITQNLAFAIANIIISIEKKSPDLVDTYIIYYATDSPIKLEEKAILKEITKKIEFREFGFSLEKNDVVKPFFDKYAEILFAKFQLFDLVNNEFDKVLWLDSDVVVLQDISEIFEKEEIAWRPAVKKLKDSIDCSKLADIDVREDDTKPNGGVILVTKTDSVSKVTTENAIEIFERIKDFPESKISIDEICFGLIARKYSLNVQLLEYRCNAVLQYTNIENPMILHCMGKNKIWKNAYLAILYPDFLLNNKIWIKLGGDDYTNYNEIIPNTKNALLQKFMWEDYWKNKFCKSHVNMWNDKRVNIGDIGRFFVQIAIPGINSNIHYELIQNDKNLIFEERIKEVIVVALHIERAALVDDVVKQYFEKIANDFFFSIDTNKGLLKIERKTMNQDAVSVLMELIDETYSFLINHYS